MNVKLTLRMDEEAVEVGKRFAAENSKSLSQLVCDYFLMLDATNAFVEEVPVSRKLHSLVGVGVGDCDERDYRLHLEAKNNERRA
ncbi:MAG: DUF6364 family protein [Raoultibacter sp.]